MLGNDVEIGPQPIRRVVAVDEALEVLFRPDREALAQSILGAGYALGATQSRVAAAEQRLGLEIKRAQQLALPAGPHPRADGADVGDREQEEEFQPLAA